MFVVMHGKCYNKTSPSSLLLGCPRKDPYSLHREHLCCSKGKGIKVSDNIKCIRTSEGGRGGVNLKFPL